MLKQFFSLLKRYILPYRKYLTWALILNFLSQWLNVFSFMAIVPILNILFKIDTKSYEYIPMDIHNLDKDVLINNAYYFVSNFVATNGAFYTLAMMGGILIFMTMLKTAGYFASAAVMVPLRTGIVRDIRIQVYNKVLSLPLSFFSEERKGDIIARMSADVTVVENSLTSSIDMLIRNPIALLVCFVTLFSVSWQMTLFVIFILPLTGWIMGVVSRKLKRQSSTAQAQWGDIMSQLDETLGGLRVIKAFIAESKMSARFSKTNNDFRDAMNEMIIRQSSAHPMSEFLGTCVIVTVLLFGGALILNTNYAPMDAATFIFYLIILYSIINPLKEFSRAFYNIPQGLASMERIDMILKAENHIVEPEQPLPLDAFTDKLEFKNVSFSYVEGRPVLNHINLTVPKGKTIALVGQIFHIAYQLQFRVFGLQTIDTLSTPFTNYLQCKRKMTFTQMRNHFVTEPCHGIQIGKMILTSHKSQASALDRNKRLFQPVTHLHHSRRSVDMVFPSYEVLHNFTVYFSQNNNIFIFQ
jgi:ATP-binding cassette, subfamily B, bacterial MsbA